MSIDDISRDSIRPAEPVPDYDDRGIDHEESNTESSHCMNRHHLQRDTIHFGETFPDNGESTIGPEDTITDPSHYMSQIYLQRDSRPIHTYVVTLPDNGENSVDIDDYITAEPSHYMSQSHLERDNVHADDPYPDYEEISSDREEFRWDPIHKCVIKLFWKNWYSLLWALSR